MFISIFYPYINQGLNMKVDKLCGVLDVCVLEYVSDVDVLEGVPLGFYDLDIAESVNRWKNKLYGVVEGG